MEAQVKTLES
jgi:uncharacterized protein CbrC (UPF0167 family)